MLPKGIMRRWISFALSNYELVFVSSMVINATGWAASHYGLPRKCHQASKMYTLLSNVNVRAFVVVAHNLFADILYNQIELKMAIS